MILHLLRLPLLASLALILTLVSTPSARSDIVCKDSDATVSREIKQGDFRKLVECLATYVKKGKPGWTDEGRYTLGPPYNWVSFDSEGGDVNEAIKIGRFLREATAQVSVNGNCFSSCFLAVVGSVGIFPSDNIGIHRPYSAADKLKLVNSSDYESYYNSVKGAIWKYLLDMDVPVTLIEKMFSVPSTDLYFLSQNDITLLSQHPAYEEWLAAQCPNALSRDERRDWLIDYNAFIADRPSPLGNGYARYLRDRERADSDCRYDIRWHQLTRAVENHLHDRVSR